MWTISLDSRHRTASLADAGIEVLIEPATSDAERFGVLRVTVPAGATIPPHDHGACEALLIPVSGDLLLVGSGGRVERLQTGRLAVVAAHERVSVQNAGSEPAVMLACFSPPEFVERLTGDGAQDSRPSSVPA
jgi:quercetin dioxygenase-like cupin family protein